MAGLAVKQVMEL